MNMTPTSCKGEITSVTRGCPRARSGSTNTTPDKEIPFVCHARVRGGEPHGHEGRGLRAGARRGEGDREQGAPPRGPRCNWLCLQRPRAAALGKRNDNERYTLPEVISKGTRLPKRGRIRELVPKRTVYAPPVSPTSSTTFSPTALSCTASVRT